MRQFFRELNEMPEMENVEAARAGLADTHGVKPFLLIVPNHLMFQWIEELLKLSRFFYICIYHKDGEALIKRKGNMRGVKAYGGVLTRHNGYLRTSIDRMKIIITTPETFAHRHGPMALSDWRRDQSRQKRKGTGRSFDDDFTKEEEIHFQKVFTRPDPTWKFDLSGCFSGLIVDEAHGVKSEQAMANMALRWLDAPFVALATATPVTSGYYNITGYLSLLETKYNINAFSSLDGKDPYTIPTDDMTRTNRLACLSSAAWEKYVNRNGELPIDERSIHSVADEGARLETVFTLELVRRTYPSYVPGSKKMTAISRSLPDCYRYNLACEMSAAQKLAFEAASARHFRRIIMPNERVLFGNRAGSVEKTMVRNSNAQRALVGLGLCVLLGFIGVPTSHKSINAVEQDKYAQARLNANCILKAAHERKLLKQNHNANVSTKEGE
jgi:hypothetical protein